MAYNSFGAIVNCFVNVTANITSFNTVSGFVSIPGGYINKSVVLGILNITQAAKINLLVGGFCVQGSKTAVLYLVQSLV